MMQSRAPACRRTRSFHQHRIFCKPFCSSPIRQQLYGMPRQQQLQLSAGVAEALARPGATQPAFLRASSDAQQDGRTGSMGVSLGLPGPPQREPLSARLAAAAATGQGGSEHDVAATFTLHNNAVLEPVPEVSESPYAACSPVPTAAAMAVGPLSGGKASSTASTAIPTSPLTPASAFAAGSSPLTGASRLPTPADFFGMQQQLSQGLSPAALAAAATPGAASGWGGSPLAASLCEAPTPVAYGLASAQRGAGLHPEVPGSAVRSPAALSSAGTPQPGFGPHGLSPLAAHRLAAAPTPGASLHGQYEIRRFRCGLLGGGACACSRWQRCRTCAFAHLIITGRTHEPPDRGLTPPGPMLLPLLQRRHRVCGAPARC